MAEARVHTNGDGRLAVGAGSAFEIHEWTGGGPGYLHVHHEDDEAWHVISGKLRFWLDDKEVEAGPRTTVWVPAGVVHDYSELETSRYLMILTPRLRKMIDHLHQTPFQDHGAVLKQYASELVSDA